VDNQHRKISGYRELTADEIALMNEAKELEAKANSLVDKLRYSYGHGVDVRCVAIAATHLETGFMYLVKAVAKPERKVA
jgi:hypothetical protein